MPTFVLHARRTPQVLVRVLVEFHKRAIEIERLTAEPGKNRKVLRISITAAANPEAARRMEANLQKIVEVVRVEVKE
jgi:acetolactate synthase small subunit